eukprot:5239915-Karenia_brevis.AAC.1
MRHAHRETAGPRWKIAGQPIQEDEDASKFNAADGPVYIDGSCLHPSHPWLAAAGWACVQVDGEGNLVKARYGCVPAGFQQSAVNAEHTAMVYAACNVSGSTSLICDCSAVVDGWKMGYKRASHHDRIQAGFWREVKMAGAMGNIAAIVKIKAHRQVTEAMTGDERRAIMGNAMADTYA